MFVSPTPDARALDTEALTTDWEGMFCLCIALPPPTYSTSGPLPPWEKLLKQPKSDIYHQNPKILNLHAWKFSKHQEDRGFSQEASRRIMAPQAPYTFKLYQGKWKTFKSWCESQDLDPF